MGPRTISILVGLLLAGAACADRAVAPYPISPPPLPEDAELAPGDEFDVRVFGEKDLSNPYQVATDGTIDFPLIGTVAVAGKTPQEVASAIEAKLADGFLKNPQVDVYVKSRPSQRISVFGQVRKPGSFPYSDNMSIVEAITLAGGFTPMAKKNSVRVTRKTPKKVEPERIFVAVEDIAEAKAPNFVLRPADVVFVDERTF